MDTSSKKQKIDPIRNSSEVNWHLDILPRQAKKALDFLSNQAWLKNSNWYLAGGTALSLQVGHRKSVDLDFFTQQEDFSSRILLGHFLNNDNWKTTINEEKTVYGELFGAKISFIAYPFFLSNQPLISYGSMQILQPLDIAVMKIIAISQRGRKRDFIDLYWCAKNIESLENIIKRLKKQYPSVAHDYHNILKSMVYFEDAENDPMPEIYFKANWKEIVSFFKKEIPKITSNIINLE